jgi:predicted GIY-YIG superfamily endonuclease
MGHAVYVLLNPQGKIYIGHTSNLALDSAPAGK